MKKILPLVLCLLLCFTGCGTKGTEFNTVDLARQDPDTDASIPAEQVVIALSTDAPLGGMEMIFSLTGDDPNAVVSIYQAQTDYNTTLSDKPVRKEKFSDLTDKILWQFKTLPAGDYLIVFSELSGATLLRSIVPSDESNGKILTYRNGEIMTDGTPILTLLFPKTHDHSEPGLVTFAYPVIEEE